MGAALSALLGGPPLWAESAEDSIAAEAAALVDARDPEAWPRVLERGGYLVKFHPPQVDSWDGRQLRARSAVEIGEEGKEGSTYGVVSYVTRTRVDKEARLVVFDEYQGITAKVPAQPEIESKLLGFLQKELNDVMRVVALDRVETALAATRAEQGSASQVAVRNDPPEIIFAERPTLLIYIDGSPVWKSVEGTTYERLLNTRPLILRSDSGTLYFHLFDGWLEAGTLDGPWKVAKSEPKGIEKAARKAQEAQPADLLDGGVADQQEVDQTTSDWFEYRQADQEYLAQCRFAANHIGSGVPEDQHEYFLPNNHRVKEYQELFLKPGQLCLPVSPCGLGDPPSEVVTEKYLCSALTD